MGADVIQKMNDQEFRNLGDREILQDWAVNQK